MRALLPLLLTACSDYDFHEAGDVLPGDVGTCEGFEAPGPGTAFVDTDCVSDPVVGTFSPTIEWQWDSNALVPGYDMVMMTPVVANLSDDNGDGLIDDSDIPEIIFTSFAGSAYSSAGPLNAISGDGSGMRWAISSAGGHTWGGSAGVAVGDLEGDGRPDVCVAGSTAAVVCIDGVDGTFKWAAGTQTHLYGYPSIADLDGDGLAEVLLGRQIFSFDGQVLGVGAYGYGYVGTSVAVNMDDDPQLEVVAGNSVYEMDGSLVWTDGGADGIPAVADFDGDGLPEVVRAGSSLVTLSDTDGTTIWQVSVPGSGGGPPTVADFDGDGEVEVGVAGLSYYTLFDNDGSVIWSNPTEDDSSSVTGSSVFDFEGDGASEVVYADEHNLYIYDGATGAILMQHEGHASGTLYEYPVIADVDNDGATEIIVGSNDMWWEGWGGITVVGDADSSWAPARPVWNQHGYHITNVNNDASIPMVQAENWASWNSFRAGGTELGPGHWLADVGIVDHDICTARCSEGVVEVYLVVDSTGRVAAEEVSLRLSREGTDVFTDSLGTLASGESIVVGPIEIDAVEWGEGSLRAVLDEEDRVVECDEDNNVRRLGEWPCE